MNIKLFLIATTFSMLLTACTSGGLSPVINKSPGRIIPAKTLVLEDDSVYSVAWRFGLDYQDIVKWNGLVKPYVVIPGQQLRLYSFGTPAPREVTIRITPPPKPVPKPSVKPKPLEPPQPAPSRVTATTSQKWVWPAKGKLIEKFSRGKGQNGIRIVGTAGSPIRATTAGMVVYVGEGLRGYGKLIIIKHSEVYLTAYAHNRKILVAEGAHIRTGQQIAQMGSTDSNRTMLYFETRKNGKPVDPLMFLN